MPATITAKDIMDDCRGVYLNDSSATLFTNTRLLPLVKKACDSMETRLEENNITCKNENSVPILVVAGVTELNPLPSDFVWPIALKERIAGSTDLYADMYERSWEPNISPGDKLVYWAWRADRIKFVGALTNREVLLRYQKSFPIVNVASDAVYGYAKQFLSAKVAALAHLFIQQNELMAKTCNDEAEGNLSQVINIQAKKSQAVPVRRRPWSPFR